ncbi:MAG: hypothetical protein ACJAYY_000239 [Paraglaciecola sp.]|jgi:hypothetical protein|uniref:DUF3108 domain-containing protein n=1 Tax=Polaribacter sp. TaxID=1920175 RepID=UPI003AD79986
MKNYTPLIYALFFLTATFSQVKEVAFKSGESLRFKMSYSGFLRAGTAVLKVEETELNGEKVFHSTGSGWTSGMIKWFFQVDDTYESYFDKDTIKPYLFKRKIDEGGYKKHRITSFNYNSQKAYVQDFINQKDSSVAFNNVQDMVSSFYYLRNINTKNLKKGDEIKLDMFMDSQVYPFKLRFLGKEVLKTKFGKVNSLIFTPLVQSGRVFKAEESVTIWITDDANKIPIKMRASLAVGSLRAELEAYSGLANPFGKI